MAVGERFYKNGGVKCLQRLRPLYTAGSFPLSVVSSILNGNGLNRKPFVIGLDDCGFIFSFVEFCYHFP